MISAHNRDVSRRKALRKRRIAREICGWEMYDNLHQYSKNKIHCSCPLCRAKTNMKNMKWKSGNEAKNWKHSDIQKIQLLHDQIVDLYAAVVE